MGPDVSPGAQDQLGRLQEHSGDQRISLNLRVTAGEKKVFIYPRPQIDVTKDIEEEENGQTAPGDDRRKIRETGPLR